MCSARLVIEDNFECIHPDESPRARSVDGGGPGAARVLRFIPYVGPWAGVGSRASSFLSPPLWERLRFWRTPRIYTRGKYSCAIERGVRLRKVFETKIQYLISGEMEGQLKPWLLSALSISEQMFDSEQRLKLAVIDGESAAEVIGLVSTAAFGKWRDHRNILLTRTKTMRVQPRNDIPAILDGEKINLGGSAEITFVPKAVTVLVPACR